MRSDLVQSVFKEEKHLQKPIIDETKLSEAMKMIEDAAALMAEKDCDGDKEAKENLEKLQQDLRNITGNKKLEIKNYQRYWAAADLKTTAKKALMPIPIKEDLTELQIKEIVTNILKHDEAEMDWWLNYLKVNTGLDNLTDYIFYPDVVGLNEQATLEQIADKIIADKK